MTIFRISGVIQSSHYVKQRHGKQLTGETSVNTVNKKGRDLAYVLITPARNEEAFIEQTIKSVVGQTVLPLKWVIVSDGSTDGTDDIVKKYAAEHSWIELVRMPERQERHFAGKVHAFNAGFARVRELKYDIIGNLDADITFQEDYISFLLHRFAENPRLGVTGTPFREENQQYDYRFTSIEHVSGACQLFRRECFEEIGGYVPLTVGGIDLVAVLTARMKGWQTRTFTEKTCVHHKQTQSGRHSNLKATFRSGYHDYLMGSHPVWQIFRSVYQMTKEPFFVGGLALLAGYIRAMLTRAERPVPKELVDFRGKEQMRRLKGFFGKLLLPEKHVHSA
jgi:glycosyltransferase involved in cell wall biosynthesis